MAAISLSRVEEAAPALVSLYKSAGTSLVEHGLDELWAAVYLVLDHSGSMSPYDKDGSVRALADRVLSLAAHLDDDGRVPVVFFSTDVDAVTEISLDDHQDSIRRAAAGLGRMGRTHYEAAMDAVLDHYLDCGATDPALVVFRTDGGPSSKAAAERCLCKAAGLPLFWQFIGFGNARGHQFGFLRRLDELAVPGKRSEMGVPPPGGWGSVIDNAGFFPAGRDPRRLSDARLCDRLLSEFPLWLTAARAQGIVT
ncbi:VWA domain-containing protein [Streptomyces sp. NPDC047017]|uniref:VWA domain-containing protein n=1 Tax=Streptomyces sp. NPDC047017 TaxID=3155024 RepID=UPI003407C927